MKSIKVSELLKYIKKIINSDYFLTKVKVEGEISNIKYHGNGNIYFSLKDESSRINCIMYKWNIEDKQEQFENGDQVEVKGTVNLYERDGSLTIFVSGMEKSGLGEQYKLFIENKAALEKEGLFDIDKKRELPKFPETIGVVTSPTGAAVRDIIHIVNRRNANVNIIVYPALVQGDKSADSIVKGIEYFNEHPVDVMIVGRGGGSFEELNSFNDVKVAYSIFDSKIPIISAVGHETDFTIADFVADMRAPTPSAAAEISTPLLDDLIMNQDNMMNRAMSIVNYRIESMDYVQSKLELKMKSLSPVATLESRIEKVNNIFENIQRGLMYKYDRYNNALKICKAKLDVLNPENMINKGYVIMKDESGKPIVSTKDLHIGKSVEITLLDGSAIAEINSIEESVK